MGLTVDYELVLIKRAMIRAFKSVPVEEEKIQSILRNAWRAPSAGHLQPQDFIIVKNNHVKHQLAKAAFDQNFIEQAPVVIVVCSDTRRNVWRYWDRAIKFYNIIDGAYASMIILLTVVNEGLGVCFVGAFDDDEVSKLLGLPNEVKSIGIIPIGYPEEKNERLARIPLEKRLHEDRW